MLAQKKTLKLSCQHTPSINSPIILPLWEIFTESPSRIWRAVFCLETFSKRLMITLLRTENWLKTDIVSCHSTHILKIQPILNSTDLLPSLKEKNRDIDSSRSSVTPVTMTWNKLNSIWSMSPFKLDRTWLKAKSSMISS